MERYLCIHGHFYQPPRENPWLEAVELQDSAYPYHDWNERITAECYGPNSTSRILNGDGRIDPAMPYELRLPSGQKICLFFFDSLISRAVAFEALLMRFLSEIGYPLPRSFQIAAELAIGSELRGAFEADEPDLNKINGLLEEAEMIRIPLDEGGLAYALARNAERIALQLRAVPFELSRLRSLEVFVGMGLELPFRVNFWKIQNLFHEMLQTVYPGILQRAAEGDEGSGEWVRHFALLGEKLSIRIRQE